jgi:hypothetical protein
MGHIWNMNMQTEFERAVLAGKRRRRLWQVRLAATAGSAVVIFVACWSGGVFEHWREWFAPQGEVPIAQRGPAPIIPTAPVTTPVGPPRLTDDGAVGKMRLVATQPGRNVREGTAQLATGNADPLTYVAGALLANGASLIEVHADHVVLKGYQSARPLCLATTSGCTLHVMARRLSVLTS